MQLTWRYNLPPCFIVLVTVTREQVNVYCDVITGFEAPLLLET